MSAFAAPDRMLAGHEDVIGYWASLRRGGRLPARRDFDPAMLKRHLPAISLTQVWREPLDFRFRLAGTGLYPLYGKEITGRKLEDVYPPSAAEYWREALCGIVRSGRPSVGRYDMPGGGDGRSSGRAMLWLRLPLASDGRNVDMVLGYDVVIGAQFPHLSGIKAA